MALAAGGEKNTFITQIKKVFKNNLKNGQISLSGSAKRGEPSASGRVTVAPVGGRGAPPREVWMSVKNTLEGV